MLPIGSIQISVPQSRPLLPNFMLYRVWMKCLRLSFVTTVGVSAARFLFFGLNESRSSCFAQIMVYPKRQLRLLSVILFPSSAQCTNLLFHSRACIELLCSSDGARLGVPGLKRILGQRFCRTTSESEAFLFLSFLFSRFVVEGESMGEMRGWDGVMGVQVTMSKRGPWLGIWAGAQKGWCYSGWGV